MLDEAADALLVTLANLHHAPELFATVDARLLRHFNVALNDSPADADILCQRADLHRQANRISAAQADYQCALKIQPGHSRAFNNLGNLFFSQQAFEQAEQLYRQLIQFHPEDAVAWFNLGNCLQMQHHLDQAHHAYQQAIRLQALPEACVEMAHCHLLRGEFSSGWALLEQRWKTTQLKPNWPSFPTPAWAKGESLEHRHLLVWSEQGLGDTLQFVRFLPLVLAQARKVTLRAPACLGQLLAYSFPQLDVIDEQTPLPTHDCQCPLMSLPYLLNLEGPIEHLAPPYLRTPPAIELDWQQRLPKSQRLRIGFVWEGRQYGTPNRTRDTPLTCWQPLFEFPADWILLQPNCNDQDRSSLAKFSSTIDLSSNIKSMADTAALIEQLDLVISVDTAVAHLAGALGKPCWLMLRYQSEWRWQLTRTDSEWYPAMTLFRQTTPGDWDGVIQSVRENLASLATKTEAKSAF